MTKTINQISLIKPVEAIKIACVTLGLLAVGGSAYALRFEPSDTVSIDLDTTLAYGGMWRLEKQSKAVTTPVVPMAQLVQGSDEFVDTVIRWNSDDGDRNFDKGDMVSDRYAITSDMDIRHGQYGMFLRAQAFYDSVYFEETSWDGKGMDDWKGNVTTDCGGSPDLDTIGACASNNAEHYDGTGLYVGPESINNSMADHSISDPSHFSDKVKNTQGSVARFLDAYVYGTFPIGDHTLDLRLGRQAISWGESLMLQGGIGFAQNRIDATAATSPGVELKEIFLPTGTLYGQLDLSESLTVEAYWQYEWLPSELFTPGSYFSAQDMINGNIMLVNNQFSGNCMYGLGKTYTNADFDGYGGDHACDDSTPYNKNGPSGYEHWVQANKNYMSRAPDVTPDHPADQYGIALRKLLDGGSEVGLYFVQYHDRYPSFWAGNNGAKDEINAFMLNNAFDATYTGPTVDTSNIAGFNAGKYTIEYKERIKLYGITYNTVYDDIQMGFELTYRENQPLVPACTLADLNSGTFDESLPDVTGHEQYTKSLTFRSTCRDASAKYLSATGYYDWTNRTFQPDAATKLFGWTTQAEVFTYNMGVTLVVPPTPFWDTGIFVGEFGGWYVGDSFDNSHLKVTSIGGFTQQGNGVSAIFLPQYKNVMEGVDLTVPLFVNYTIDGSFSYFNYNERALWASIGLEAVYLSNTRVGITYSAFGGRNNMWRDRDNIAITAKYTF